eukprot:5300571-Pyramimonas_sp.AAC.1
MACAEHGRPKHSWYRLTATHASDTQNVSCAKRLNCSWLRTPSHCASSTRNLNKHDTSTTVYASKLWRLLQNVARTLQPNMLPFATLAHLQY